MNKPVHVVSVLHLSESHLAQLRSVSPRLVVQQHALPSEEQWLRASEQQFAEVLSPETEILYTHTAPFDVRLTPKLRWVQVDSAGVNLLHNTPLWKSDIPITSANGVHTVQIAEYVLTMLLAHAHRLPLASRLQQRAEWASGQQLEAFVTPEIRGKTLGVVGYGAIGRQVARRPRITFEQADAVYHRQSGIVGHAPTCLPRQHRARGVDRSERTHRGTSGTTARRGGPRCHRS